MKKTSKAKMPMKKSGKAKKFNAGAFARAKAKHFGMSSTKANC